MNVLKTMQDLIPDLNNEPLYATTWTEGPVLIIAGPGQVRP